MYASCLHLFYYCHAFLIYIIATVNVKLQIKGIITGRIAEKKVYEDVHK